MAEDSRTEAKERIKSELKGPTMPLMGALLYDYLIGCAADYNFADRQLSQYRSRGQIESEFENMPSIKRFFRNSFKPGRLTAYFYHSLNKRNKIEGE